MAPWTDVRLERIISMVLRTGVMVSAATVLLGGLCFLVRHGHEPPAYRVFRGEPAAYRSVQGVIRAVPKPDCRAVIQLGLLFLIATPITRVAFSLVGFVLERDRTYVFITLIVLAILLYSLIAEH
jgi:uncharacterized membrane protein